MRVGFGVTALARALHTGGADGIAQVTQALLPHLQTMPNLTLQPVSYGFSLPAGHPLASETVRLGAYPPMAAFSAYARLPFPRSDFTRHLDLFHATDHIVPHLRIPVVATLMDAIPLAYPEWTASHARGLKNDIWMRLARRAAHIITISEFSRREITKYFAIPAERITAIALGVDESWFVRMPEEARQRVRAAHDLPPRFFLFAGTLQPRKNLARVIEAHEALPDAWRRAVPLVVVGRSGWQSENLVQKFERGAYGDSVRWLRYLPQEDLQTAMQMADALVFPSLYEGFGLPVLEAFAGGTPVVTSAQSSLPEVAGDAALLVDPTNTSAIRDAMLAVLEQPALAESLRGRGQKRARLFPWEKNAQSTVEVYRKVLSAHEA